MLNDTATGTGRTTAKRRTAIGEVLDVSGHGVAASLQAFCRIQPR